MIHVVYTLVFFGILSQHVAADTRDVVFVIDRSGSIYYEDYYEAIDFVYNITKWLTIGSSTDQLQISVVTFSTYVTEEFSLQQYSDKTDLLNAIETLKSTSPNGQTNTHDALEFCSNTALTSGRGARPGVPQAIVILTDGVSTRTSETQRQAGILQNNGVEMYAIGIGSAVSSSSAELQAIASDPDSYYLNTVGTFSNLCLLVPELVPKLDSTVVSSAMDKCGSFNTTESEEETSSTSTDSTPIIASLATIAAIGGVVGLGFGIAKVLSIMKMTAQVPTVLAAVGVYGPASLGPANAKFTTKFLQSGLPLGDVIPSQAPTQTFSPRSIASIVMLD